VRFSASLAWVDPSHYLELACEAERCGWDSIILSDHLVHQRSIRSTYPYREDGQRPWEAADPWPEVWVAIAAMAAVTSRLRFMPAIYVLPLRDPFSVAKTVGTVSLLSGGRVSLGCGVGWLREDFALLGREFERRGARMAEMVQVMRLLWSGEMVEHHGAFYDFEELQMCPAVKEPIPVIMGGMAEAALRRVGRLADGWIPPELPMQQIRDRILRIRDYRRDYGREGEPLTVYAMPIEGGSLDNCRRLEEFGVTHLIALPWFLYGQLDRKPRDYLGKGADLNLLKDGLRRFSDEVIAKMNEG